MRTSTAEQLPLVPQISGHKHMDELREMSKIIDLHPPAAQRVLSDLVAGGINPRGERKASVASKCSASRSSSRRTATATSNSHFILPIR
ncbi:MAG: hypothetical protein GY811_26575 [Myxococcales bacterium]|nr:hypothetical protein [Myxococcales bacterium]